MKRKKVAVVGGGVVGVLCACFLQREGHDVTLYERKQPGGETSFGNSGVISPAAVIPIAMPGLIPRIPSWLFKSDGPLSIDGNVLLEYLPWLLRFIRNSRESKVREISKALRILNIECLDLLLPLLKEANISSLVEKKGMLYVYRSYDDMERDKLSRELRSSTGLENIDVARSDLEGIEPSLVPDFVGGTFIPDAAHSVNPYRLVKCLSEHFEKSGGIVEKIEIVNVSQDSKEKAKLITENSKIEKDLCVIAAGIWSDRFTRDLGYRVPILSHRGYHVTVTNPGVTLNTIVCPVGYMATIVPMEMGIRIGGTVELAKFEKPPNALRPAALLRNLKSTIRDVNIANHTTWMGNRPCTPDSLPIIGFAPDHRSILFAFGHGHQGLLGAPKTAQIINDLVSGRQLLDDVTPYDIMRFE